MKNSGYFSILTGAMLFFLVSVASATTYYVDSSGGSDSQDGKSIATAWKSIGKVNASSFQPGDSILFKRGEKWYETLNVSSSGTETSPIFYGVYGSGPAPVITGQRVYNGNWSVQSGNVWKTSFSWSNPWRLLQDGVEKLMAKSLGEIDGVKYFWFFDDDNNLVYLYSDVDPATTRIEMNLAENGVYIGGKHDVVLRDLDMQGGSYRSLGLGGGSYNILVVHCRMGAYGHMGVAGSSFHHLTVDSSAVDSHFAFDYGVSSQRGTHDGIGLWGNVHHCRFVHDTIRNWGHTGVTFEAKTGTRTEYNKLQYCLMESPGIPYSRPFETDGPESQYNDISYNVMRDYTVRSQVGGRYNIIHHNLIYNFRNSLIKDYGTAQAFSLQGLSGDARGNVMEYNTIVDMDEPAIQFIGSWGKIYDNVFRNNIVCNAGRDPRNTSMKGVAVLLPGSETIGRQYFYNNCIYSPGRENTVAYKGSVLTVEEFNDKNGVYEDSVGGNIPDDPLFKDYPGRDFHLRDSSLCINAARPDTAYFNDFDGHTVPYGMGPDIGAYEHTGSVPLVASLEYVINPCNYEVQFTGHALSNNPPAWHWDFGDGHSSAQQNVTHEYDTAGQYTVSLVVTDSTGSDTAVAVVALVPVLPMPVGQGAERCGEGSVTLVAHGAGDTLKWFDAPQGGTLVAMGDTFHTPSLKETTTYYVASTILGETQIFHGGKTDTTAGQGSFYPWDDNAASWGLKFDASTDIIIKSVKVYNGVSTSGSYTGERTFRVVDGAGEVVAEATVNVTMGEQRLQLNMAVPAGQGYALLSDRHVGMWRDEGGAVYPYVFGPVTITGMTRYDGLQPGGRSDYYYFFYDWEVEASSDSVSCRTPVTAVVHKLPSSEFLYFTHDSTTAFSLKPVVDSCLWNFGDGSYSRDTDPEHTYPKSGLYEVTLVTWGNCNNEVLNDTARKEILVGKVPFLVYECMGEGYGYATVSSDEPYVPLVKIDENKIIYVSPAGGGDGSSEESPATFAAALQKATPGTTILALDGEYKINLDMPVIHDVNIIAKNKWGAKIDCGSGNALNLGNRKDIHHINIIGFEIYGDDGGEFIFAAGDAKDIGTNHFYLSDNKFHDLKMGLYTGLHSHDWTVDRCMYYNSRMSYLWYMMGWHQTVMNSIMYNNTYYSIAIRGHYPLDEEFDYYHPENNIPITDRESSWLAPDDWTHKIINNTFGTCTNTSRPGDTHMSIFYNKPSEDPPLRSEDVYFPPQNITIANNAFIDNGPIHKKPVIIFAERGINTGEPWSVNGVYIYNNVTDKSEVLVQEDYPIESIDLSKNTVNAKHMSFLNAAGHDYRLTPGSTDLIDQGSNTPYYPNTDFRGSIRDRHPDVGAYEYYELPAGTGKIVESKHGIRIYPNPAGDYIRVEIPEDVNKYRIVLYNVMSEEVKVYRQENKPGRKPEINISDLSQGFYVCRLYDMQKKTEYNGKFLVSR